MSGKNGVPGFGLDDFSFIGGSSPLTVGNSGSGGGDLSGLLGLFNNNGGLFGLGDLATGGLFSFGSSLLGGLGSLLGGKSDSQKAAKSVFNLAKNRLGQSPTDPEQYLAEYQRARLPVLNTQANRLNQQFGLDSGVGQSVLAQQMESPLASFLLQGKQRNDVLKTQNDNALLALMGQVGRSM